MRRREFNALAEVNNTEYSALAYRAWSDFESFPTANAERWRTAAARRRAFGARKPAYAAHCETAGKRSDFLRRNSYVLAWDSAPVHLLLWS
jgi:hypothetical protein